MQIHFTVDHPKTNRKFAIKNCHFGSPKPEKHPKNQF